MTNHNMTPRIDSFFPKVGPAHPNDILAALTLLGISQREIAEKCEVSPVSVNDTISGKARSYNIATYLSVITGIPMKRMFGDRYNYTPRQRKAA